MQIGSVGGYIPRNEQIQLVRTGHENELSPAQVRGLKRSGAVECATCASRKYQDGSDEMVSFKSPAHISPAASAGRVMAHEQEHVSNAYKDAGQNNGRVVNASVSIKTAICPECGRSYTSGGLTRTSIKYNEDNPYGRNMKAAQKEAMTGNSVDAAV
ncbi:MAG: hypothetical protein ACI4EV_06625 [Lachnospiraceae bacterium]